MLIIGYVTKREIRTELSAVESNLAYMISSTPNDVSQNIKIHWATNPRTWSTPISKISVVYIRHFDSQPQIGQWNCSLGRKKLRQLNLFLNYSRSKKKIVTQEQAHNTFLSINFFSGQKILWRKNEPLFLIAWAISLMRMGTQNNFRTL